MKIDESSVRIDASHEYARRQSSVIESEFSFRSALQEARPAASLAEAGKDEEQARLQRLLEQLVDTLLAMVSGQKCRSNCRNEEIAALDAALPVVELPTGTGTRGGRIIEWNTLRREKIEEHERTEVRGQGEVRTADGRQIAFDLELSMCRDYSCTREIRETGRIELKDPLVINFHGKAAELSAQRFSFDIDADGTPELLPELVAGSGYLAFDADADADGKISDGSELFGATGPHAGNGFADLARHDADGNGWIDEADPAWSALGVWFPDGKITPLKEAGVGALNLANAWSPFELKDEQNRQLGNVWRTGMYLAEDGSVGSLQQIDLGTQAVAATDGAANPRSAEPANSANSANSATA